MVPQSTPPTFRLLPGESPDRLRQAWQRMQRVRRFEEHIVEQYAFQNQLFARKETPPYTIKCPTHLSIGQEAAAVGACEPLSAHDVAFSNHRCHAHYVAKGGSLRRGMAELYGRSTGCAAGKGGSMHLVDPEAGMMGASAIVGGSIPLALGAALASSLRGDSRVAIAFFGDGAVEQGVFSESLALAGLRRLPMIFFCEDNGYATLSHRTTRQHVPIGPRAESLGVPSETIDGNDVIAVGNAAGRAAARARAGQGPTLIVAETYRWFAHVGTEPDTGNMRRTADELALWKARCPVATARVALLARGYSEAQLAGDEAAIEAELTDAVEFARSSPEPGPNDLHTSV